MGLNLSKETRKSKVAKAEKSPKTEKGGLGLKDKHSKAKPPKVKIKSEIPLDQDDEVITVNDAEVVEEQPAEIQIPYVGAFEKGLVDSALQDAVNTYWKKSAESDLFMTVLSTVMTHEGTYFGSIFVKSSFLRKTGGSALL